MYREIRQSVRGESILEVGSGIGTYSEMLYRDFRGRLFLLEVDSSYVAQLKRKFPDDRVTVRKLDLTRWEDFLALRDLRFDTIVCMNVLEHISDDVLALRRMRSLLSENGILILLVPAHRCLYNTIDEVVGHKRRYAKQELLSKLTSSGFLIRRLSYYDMFGILGWYVSGNVLKRRHPPSASMAFKYFDMLVPGFQLVERLLPYRPTGISIIAICSAAQPLQSHHWPQ